MHRYVCNTTCIFVVQAVQRGAMYPRKLWFIYGMEGGEWWEWDGVASRTNCSKEDMKRFLDRAITVVPSFDGEMESRQPKGQEVCTHMYGHRHKCTFSIYTECAFMWMLVRVHLCVCVHENEYMSCNNSINWHYPVLDLTQLCVGVSFDVVGSINIILT